MILRTKLEKNSVEIKIIAYKLHVFSHFLYFCSMKQKKTNRLSRLIITGAALAIAIMMVFAYAITPETPQPIKKPIRVMGGSANLRNIYRFHDINDTQIVAAQQFGIEPVKTRDDIDSVFISSLQLIETSNLLRVDKLTHSVPYLTPNAAELLYTIATNFQDKLQSQGLAQYQIIATSFLRTEDDVRRLRRVNRNAVINSCHMYATKFDIAYNCFEQVDSLPDFEGATSSHKVLVNTLGETLKELRDSERCYVKFERGQPCFHITTRK